MKYDTTWLAMSCVGAVLSKDALSYVDLHLVSLLPSGPAVIRKFGQPTDAHLVSAVRIQIAPTASAYATWRQATLPLALTVSPSAGTGGTSRFTLRWADRAIKNTWLEALVFERNYTATARRKD